MASRNSDPFAPAGDQPGDTPTTLGSVTDTPDTPTDTPTERGGRIERSADAGPEFDVEETRARYLEKGRPADILALVEHYTGQPAREDENR